MIAVPHSPANGIAKTATKIASFSITAAYTKGGPIG
jgi:hypothetical protein